MGGWRVGEPAGEPAFLNKGNLTAGAVQVEANLHEQLSDRLHFRKHKCC